MRPTIGLQRLGPGSWLLGIGVGVDGVDRDPEQFHHRGRPKRWVVFVRRRSTGIVLAGADEHDQSAVLSKQVAGRVGLFLQVEDFEAAYEWMNDADVVFVTSLRRGRYVRVVVFLDVAGSRWDLFGPLWWPAPGA
jgi:hypothetical protein